MAQICRYVRYRKHSSEIVVSIIYDTCSKTSVTFTISVPSAKTNKTVRLANSINTQSYTGMDN